MTEKEHILSKDCWCEPRVEDYSKDKITYQDIVDAVAELEKAGASYEKIHNPIGFKWDELKQAVVPDDKWAREYKEWEEKKDD